MEAHLRQAAETEGVEIEDIYKQESECPEELAYLWALFTNLHLSRQAGFGPCAISYSDIWSYSQLTRQPLETWEVLVIKRIDMVYLESAESNRKKKSKEVENN